MRFLFTTLLVMFLIGCDAPTPARVTDDTITNGLALPAGFDTAEQTIQATNLLADVSTIASDEFEGRGPGSEGDRKARAFLAFRKARPPR